LDRGYCLMIGGDSSVVEQLDPIFNTLAPGFGTIVPTPTRTGGDDRPESGYIHAGPSGAGHFVKDGPQRIENGLMQAYAEGFDILRGRLSDDLQEEERFALNLPDIAEVWRRGSVISFWLLDLCALELAGDHDLKQFNGRVADSGEGRWTVEAAMEETVPANVLTAALFARYSSRTDDSFADKLLSAMRFGFGGHVEMPQ
jgi:6-phosphogluconate dehydrogenase